MYHGLIRTTQPIHRSQWVEGVGTMPVLVGSRAVIRHAYTCDHCGQAYAFQLPADEDFYCHSSSCHAIKLVSIDPKFCDERQAVAS